MATVPKLEEMNRSLKQPTRRVCAVILGLGLLIFPTAANGHPQVDAIGGFTSGFMHPLTGMDHLLLLLGLFFLTRDLGGLLFQMTLFTLAHSLTLGLAVYGVLTVPLAAVKIAAALGIIFIALENLFCDKISRGRPYLVVACGLIHGLGFSHSFQGNVTDRGDFLPALLGFNLGIGLGQFVVVAVAFAAVARWWRRDFYQRIIARPASVAVAVCGMYWALERSF